MVHGSHGLSALGPGLGVRSPGTPDIQQFARRRVEHLREKVLSGDIDADRLQRRLDAQFGEAAKGVTSGDGSVDFDRLQGLIAEQQASKLQDRLQTWFGDDARGIVSKDGTIDADRFNALSSSEQMIKLRERLQDRFGDQAKDIIGEDGTVDAVALRALLVVEDLNGPYESASHRRQFQADDRDPFLDFRI